MTRALALLGSSALSSPLFSPPHPQPVRRHGRRQGFAEQGTLVMVGQAMATTMMEHTSVPGDLGMSMAVGLTTCS